LNIFLELDNIARTFDNIDAILFFLNLKKEATLNFRTGLKINVKKDEKGIAFALYELYKSVPLANPEDECGYCWKVDWKNKILILPNGLRFYLYSIDPLIFSETFIHDIHFVGFDLNEKVVVDIGAFVGDTALYYASLGAKVYAYEPHPINFYWLKKNVELNPHLKDKIKIFNYAVGNDGEIEIIFNESIDGGFTLSSRYKGKAVIIKSVSLRTILDQIDTEPYLLKADCKGCEFNLIEDNSISRFEKIKIEYTAFNKPKVDFIIKKIKDRGFNRIRIFKHNFGIYHITDHGTIYAEK
jgi:FkbM family methyltransferase